MGLLAASQSSPLRIHVARTCWLDFWQAVFDFVNGRSNAESNLLMTWQVLKYLMPTSMNGM
jgi:hypothetical protein